VVLAQVGLYLTSGEVRRRLADVEVGAPVTQGNVLRDATRGRLTRRASPPGVAPETLQGHESPGFNERLDALLAAHEGAVVDFLRKAVVVEDRSPLVAAGQDSGRRWHHKRSAAVFPRHTSNGKLRAVQQQFEDWRFDTLTSNARPRLLGQ